MKSAILLILFTLLTSAVAFAGGSDTPVRVIKFTKSSETDYVLIVSPVEKSDDHLRGCERFEVHGTYGRLDGAPWYKPWIKSYRPTKESHLAALQYLQKYAGSKETIRLGYMGHGFGLLDPKNRCIVESRALEFGDGYILSYFHVV